MNGPKANLMPSLSTNFFYSQFYSQLLGTTAPAAVVANKVDANRLTGADKKNRDQKRHGATRGNKGDAPAAKDGKREFDRRSGTGV